MPSDETRLGTKGELLRFGDWLKRLKGCSGRRILNRT